MDTCLLSPIPALVSETDDLCILYWATLIIIIIIIAFKGAIRDFLQSPHSAANCLQPQVARVQSCANHVQHIERLSYASVMLRATWYEGTAQLLSLTEFKSHLFQFFYSVGWTIKPMKDGRKPVYPEKTPGDERQKMPHTTAWRFKPQAILEPA